jgi:tRNA 2-thiouridine synthesizing protein A
VEQAEAGARIRLLADDPMAEIDVPHLAQSLGLIVLESLSNDSGLSFLIEKP